MRRILLILGIVVVVGVVVLGVIYYVHQNSAAKLRTRAQLALTQSKNYERAVDYAKQAIAKDPADWRGYYVLSQAYSALGRYEEARQALADAANHGATGVDVPLAMADTYAMPGLRILESEEGSHQVSSLVEAIACLRKANEYLLTVKPPEEADAITVRHHLGVNLTRLGGAQRLLSDRLEREAQVAETARNIPTRDERRKDAKDTAEASDKSLREAMAVLLDVVTRDPNRAAPAGLLVEMCIRLGDEATLAKAHDAILALDDPPVGPAVALILRDFRTTLAADPQGTAAAQNAARRLDTIIARQPKDPSLPDALLARGEIAVRQGDFDKADQLSQQVLGGTVTLSQQIGAKLMACQVLMGQGKWVEAEKALQKLKTEVPGSPAVQFAYATAAMALAKKEPAREAMRAITEIEKLAPSSDPIYAGARRFLAESLLADGVAVEAFADAKAYLDKCPDEPVAIRLFVAAAKQTDQEALGRQAAQAAVKNHPDQPDVLMAAYDAFTLLDDPADARKAAEKAAACKPVTLSDRLAICGAWVILGRTSEAEKLLTDELVRTPKDARVPMELGRLYAATDRPRQAIEQYRAAVRIDDWNLPYRETLAAQLYATGLFEECDTELQTILARAPDHAGARWLASQLRGLRGQSSPEERIPQAPYSERASLAVAQACLARGAAKECIDLCLKELKVSPSNRPLRQLLAQAYLMIGDPDRAVAEWSQVLAAVPDQLPIYYQLASALGRSRKSDAVEAALTAIPGARPDRVQMAMGWLHEKAGELDAAADVYRRLKDRQDFSQDIRNQARVQFARTLARTGNVNGALAEFQQLVAVPEWRSLALFNQAVILALAGRPKEAEAPLATLLDISIKAKDAGMIERIIALRAQARQFDEAKAVCDKYMTMLPNDARPCLARASVLVAAGKTAESIEWFRKAIDRQPGALDVYISLARALDSSDKSADAMVVLKQLEAVGQTGKTASLIEQGGMFARLGLQPQAVECFEQLAQIGYGGDPSVQYLLGQAFARLGRAERAREVLRKIPGFAPQYISARLILAELETSDDAKVQVLREAQKVKPGEPAFIDAQMRILIRAQRPADAVKVYQAAVAAGQSGGGVPPYTRTLMLQAIQAMVMAGDLPGAAALTARAADETQEPVWRHIAALFAVQDNPQKARGWIRDAAAADTYDALFGILLAVRTGDVADPWFNRLQAVEADMARMNPPRYVSIYDRMLSALAAGSPAQAQSVVDAMKGTGGVGRKALAEMLSSGLKDPASRTTAAQILKASLANDLGIPTLGRLWAMQVLKAHPTAQLAGAVALQSDPDPVVLKEILATMQPADSLFARSLTARQAMADKQYGKAAQIWAALAQSEGQEAELLFSQASALELAGQLPEALALYKQAWQASKDLDVTTASNAANNAAYLITTLYPRDAVRLAEARSLVDQALKDTPPFAAARISDTAGWITFLQGHPELAIQELRKAIKGLPDSPEVHFHLASVESAVGHTDMAKWHYTATVDLGEKLKADQGGVLSATTQDIIRQAREALTRIK